MAIERQQLVDAGRFMVVPLERLAPALRASDADASGAVDSPAEMADLYDRVTAGGDGEGALAAIAGLMVQTRVDAPEALGDRGLREVAELAPVWNGLGRIVRAPGRTAGTAAVQAALNTISDRLSDYPDCHVGRVDAGFGPRTEAGVRAFQAVHGELDENGRVDVDTLTHLDRALRRARTLTVNRPPPVEPGRLRMISYNDRFGSDCVLTFDDGPDPDTERVLDALAAAGIRGATFFVMGINALRYPRILRRIVDDGHVLGNHTYDHPDLRRRSVAQVEEQLRRCQDAVDDALGERYVMDQMRPPYGALNDRALSVLRGLDLAVLLWQVDSNDWRPENRRNLQRIVDNVFAGSAPVTGGRGGLILFHDIHPTTGTVTPRIIEGLQSAGLNFTTAQALLERKFPPS